MNAENFSRPCAEIAAAETDAEMFRRGAEQPPGQEQDPLLRAAGREQKSSLPSAKRTAGKATGPGPRAAARQKNARARP